VLVCVRLLTRLARATDAAGDHEPDHENQHRDADVDDLLLEWEQPGDQQSLQDDDARHGANPKRRHGQAEARCRGAVLLLEHDRNRNRKCVLGEDARVIRAAQTVDDGILWARSKQHAVHPEQQRNADRSDGATGVREPRSDPQPVCHQTMLRARPHDMA
jgi:hypothetical protein